MCGGHAAEEVAAAKESDAAKMKAFFSKDEQAPGGFSLPNPSF